MDRHSVDITFGNLFDRLYAEAANVAFFRREPGRNVIVSWQSEL